MTKQPKVRKPHPVLHGIGLVLSVTLCGLIIAQIAATSVLHQLA